MILPGQTPEDPSLFLRHHQSHLFPLDPLAQSAEGARRKPLTLCHKVKSGGRFRPGGSWRGHRSRGERTAVMPGRFAGKDVGEPWRRHTDWSGRGGMGHPLRQEAQERKWSGKGHPLYGTGETWVVPTSLQSFGPTHLSLSRSTKNLLVRPEMSVLEPCQR